MALRGPVLQGGLGGDGVGQQVGDGGGDLGGGQGGGVDQTGRIVIQPSGTPRGGWESAFASMAERGDDVLLDAEAASLSSWDAEEWQWD